MRLPRRIRLFHLAVLILLVNVLTLRSSAQDYLTTIGRPTFLTTFPVDSGDINISNGELQMQVPLASPPQRGGALSAAEGLVYDSRIWQIVFNGSTYSWQPTNVPSSSAGWRFINAQSGKVQSITTTSPCDVYPPRAAWATTSFGYVDPTGAPHGFAVVTTRQYTTRQGNACYDSSQPDSPSADGLAIDSSGYHIYVTNYATATVYDRNGGQVYPKVEDVNGNYFTTDANNNLVDTRGNTPVLTTVNGSTTYYDVLAPGASTQRYTVVSAPISVSTNFQEGAVAEWTGTLTAIQSITLPGSQGSYQFSYDSYGEISSITLPWGGVVQYGWSNFVDSYQNSNRWLTSRVRDGGTWSYTPAVVTQCSSSGTGCVEQVTVTPPSPNSNDIVYKLTLNNGAWNSEIDRYAGSGSGRTLLQMNTTTYDFSNQCDPTVCGGSQYIKATMNTTTLADVGLSRSETYTYDGPSTGNLLADKIYDYYSGTLPSQPTLETDYVYGYSGMNAQPSVTSTTVVSYPSGNAATVSLTTQGYDETPLTSTSSLPNHELLPGAKANLTSVHQWVNTSNTYLSTTYGMDDAGVRRSSTDPNGSTMVAYDSTDSFPSTVTPPVPSSGITLTTSMQSDPGTGLMMSVTDSNGVKQQIPSYDPLNRPSEQDVLDLSGTTVAKTTYSYTLNQASKHTYQSSSVYTDSEVLTDAYGRSIRAAVSNGQSTNPWYQQDTCYDASGNVRFLSYAYSGTGFNQSAVCSGGGDSYIYDPLGRPSTITHSDGTHISYSYGGRAVQITDENGVSRIIQTDGLGRIAAVCEISSNANMSQSGSPQACGLDIGGTGFLTNYSYDLANHTTTVAQGVQGRTFQTDSLGRQVMTVEPERGTTTYSYTYNSTGLAVSRVRPQANQTSSSNTTISTTQYDVLGRVVSETYTDSAPNPGATPTKTFYYDSLPASLGWAPSPGYVKGRLVATATSSSTGSLFSYDATGRVTSTWQCAPSICGTAAQSSRGLSFAYDWAGNLTNQSDPAAGSISYNRTVAGQVTSILQNTYQNATNPSSLVSNVSNTPFGSNNYQLGNGLSQVTTFDAMGRTTGYFACSGSASPFCANGTQLWGGTVQYSGQRVLQNCDTVLEECENPGYDEFNRLTSVTDITGNPSDVGSFSYSYDRWGNRVAMSASAGGTAPNDAVTQPNTNNQLSQVGGYGYDSAGNLVNDGMNSYTYDAEGNVSRVNGGSYTYTYDAVNNRVQSQSSAGTYEYIYDVEGNQTSTWLAAQNFGIMGRIYWDGEEVAFRGGDGGQTYFLHKDYLGSTRLRTNYQGQIADTERAGPFGEDFQQQVYLAAADQDPGEYAGLDYDKETTTEHAQFRQYASTHARWVSPDPYDGSYDFTNPQSFNRYSYAGNSPMTFTDPSGLFQLPPQNNNCGFLCTIASGFATLGSQLAKVFGFGSAPPSFQGSLQPRPGSTSALTDQGNGLYTMSVFVYGLDDPVSGLSLPTSLLITGGGAAATVVPNKENILLCAAKYGSAHSVASLLGLGNNYAANLFGGNSASGLVNLGNSIFGGGPAPDFAKMALGGASLGLPINNVRTFTGGGSITGLNGATGYLRGQALQGIFNAATESGAIPSIAAEGGQIAIQGGLTAGEFASGVGIGKFVFDAATFGAGLVSCAAR